MPTMCRLEFGGVAMRLQTRFTAKTESKTRKLLLAAAFVSVSACAGGGQYTGLANTPDASASGSETLFGSYLAARQASIERDPALAATYYSRALEAEPDNLIILERAFLLQLAAGDMKAAKPLARQIIEERPRHRFARMVLGLEAVGRRQYKDARDHFEQSAPGLYNALAADIISAWTYAGENNLIAAEESLAKIGGLGQDTILQSYHSALIFDLKKMPDQAEQRYLKALELSGNASMRIVDAYGIFLERQDRGLEAEALYESFLQFSPGNPMIEAALVRVKDNGRARPLIKNVQDGSAEAIYGVAGLLSADRNIDLPIIYLQLALDLSPGLMEARMLLGDIYQQAGRHEDAVRTFAQVPSGHPYGQEAMIRIAGNLERLERTPEAIAVLDKAARGKNASAEILGALGDLYRTEQNFGRAIAMYDKAIAHAEPGKRPDWLLYYTRGAAYEQLGKWPLAERDLRKALSLAPNQPLILNYLGYGWVDQGKNLGEALQYIQRAVELSPNSGFIIDSLGWAYYRLGEYERAIKYLERAVELEPEDPTINDHLGDAFWMVGRTNEARFQWHHALVRDPLKAQATLIEQKIANGLAPAIAS